MTARVILAGALCAFVYAMSLFPVKSEAPSVHRASCVRALEKEFLVDCKDSRVFHKTFRSI